MAAITAVAGTQFIARSAQAALTDEQEKALIEKVNNSNRR